MEAKACVDGPYNAGMEVCGANTVLFLRKGVDPIPLLQPGDRPAFTGSRNVAGKMMAATLIIRACKEVPGLEEFTLYYDYAGIECWAKGSWRADTALSREYRDAVEGLPFRLSLRKVKVHTGDEYNEAVNKLAKQAYGL